MFVDVTQIAQVFKRNVRQDGRQREENLLDHLNGEFISMRLCQLEEDGWNSSLGGEKRNFFPVVDIFFFFFLNFVTVAKKIERVGNLTTRWRFALFLF